VERGRPEAGSTRRRFGVVARILSRGVPLVAALAVAFVAPAAAEGAAGDLDPTFSGDGKQTTDFGIGATTAAAMARQPDGKIVAVGTDQGHGPSKFALARYNPDGSLDTTFSGNGKQLTHFGPVGDRFAVARAVALQDDGKIVVVGIAGFSDFGIARYNPNGSLDTTFSGDGKQRTDFGTGQNSANGVALQDDGKIVVVGTANFGDFAIARYNPNGSLDTTFSGDGKQTTDFFGNGDAASAVAIQANGKIVSVGGALDNGPTFDYDFALARYNADGSPDSSFSGDGRQTTEFRAGLGDVAAKSVALQGDGKIVAVGGGIEFNQEFVLARYNSNGSLDPSFSGDGKQTTSLGLGNAGASGMALRPDGKIVAVGEAFVEPNVDFALARYNPNGSLDTTFSGDGKQTTDFGNGDDTAAGVALRRDGRIIAVGSAGGSVGEKFALARYKLNGSLDPSFSGDGKQTTDFGGGDEEAHAVALQDDGKIVTVGRVGSGGVLEGDFAIARHNPDGSLDKSFSGDSKLTTDFGGLDDANAVAVQGNGKIVAVGQGGDGEDFALARYNPDGSLDKSFSGDGKQTTNFSAREGANAVALQPNGKIVVAGRIGFADGDFGVARYNPDGSLDTKFSGDGKVTTSFTSGEFRLDEAKGVAIQGDGRIVVVGGAAGDFGLARYRPGGLLDKSFSGDGKQTTDFASYDGANAVALQGDGRIVAIGGGGGGPSGDRFALARYTVSGSLDPSFSGDGKQTINMGGLNTAAGGALQANGKIIAVGGAGLTELSDFGLIRDNPNGLLDASFSGNGKQTTDFGENDAATGVAIQRDGRIVAVGFARGPNGSRDFALARYSGG
jgi:uncharacterized delta-60 repeat protein